MMDTKHEIEMIEDDKPTVHYDNAPAGAQDMMGQELTGYEDLTLFQTLKVFKKTSLICLAVSFSAAAEGYEVNDASRLNPIVTKCYFTCRSECQTTSTQIPGSITHSGTNKWMEKTLLLPASWPFGAPYLLPVKSWAKLDFPCAYRVWLRNGLVSNNLLKGLIFVASPRDSDASGL